MKRSAKELDYSVATEETALYAKALAHPARIVILKHLSAQDCCYTGDLLNVSALYHLIDGHRSERNRALR